MYKNIRIKKKGGGYRTQRVQVLKSGKYKFVKNKPTRRRNPSPKRSAPRRRKSPKRTYTRRRRTMARRRKKRGSRKQSIGSWGTSAIALGIAVANVFARAMETGQTWEGFANAMVKDYTGWDSSTSTWAAANLARGYAPIIGAVVFKKGMSMVLKTAKMKSALPSF